MFWQKKNEMPRPEPAAGHGKVRKLIWFYGRVQGVGFRFYSVQKARQLGLTGWVKNLVDGSVSMEVQGDPRLIEELIAYLGKQRYVRIDRVETKELPLDEEERSFHEAGAY